MVRFVGGVRWRNVAFYRNVRLVVGSEVVMTLMVWAGAIVTVFLIGYLVHALLNAERI